MRRVRETLDRALAGLVLVLLSPVMAAVGLAIRLSMGQPVLFWQKRVGIGDREFAVCKFRTMNEARDAAGELLPDKQRLTGLGRFLRRMSLDELPQLWNVLQGEMSLVGPRPLPGQYLPRYTARQRRRHEVKPGITGWAQIHGRNALDWEQKLEMDVWYVEHRSLGLDLRILAATVWTVLRQEGISCSGDATMLEFLGALGKRRPV
ncbi:MAG: sugar transferase [Acidobacteria bacterium]|nr:sugar transferase [Acidobacteriota bacterium]